MSFINIYAPTLTWGGHLLTKPCVFNKRKVKVERTNNFITLKTSLLKRGVV